MYRYLVILSFLAICSWGFFPARPMAQSVQRTYTLDADFDEGSLLNVNHDIVQHQLQLNQFSAPLPFVYIACSGRGTVVRIDINTGTILGEYLTAPDGMGRDPSRTTVDKFGNVWVANRAESGFSGGENKGSIVRIGVIIGGTRCDADRTPNPGGQYLRPPFVYSTVADRDGDDLIKTSIDRGNILPWTNAGGVDTHGGVSTADDEAIINYARVTGTGTRTVAIDRCNDVWVGGTGDFDHEKVDGITGLPVPEPQFKFNLGCGGYGGLIDGNGVLWSARGGSGLLRYDAKSDSGSCLGHSCGDYGLGIDPNTGHIWHTALAGGNVYEIAPDGTCLNAYNHGESNAQGVAVDNSGNVWVAHAFIEPPSTTVGHLRTDGTFVGNVPVGRGPTGVAVDANGKIWVANYYSNTAISIDPNAGDTGGGGYIIGAVDKTVDLGPGAAPYNYSDMTGFVAIGATSPSGTWTVVYDACGAAVWNSVSWASDYPSAPACDASQPPPPPSVDVEVRAADNRADLPNQPFVLVANHGAIAGMGGRFIEIRATLSRPAMSSPSPILYDLTVNGTRTGPSLDPCFCDTENPLIACPADTEVFVPVERSLEGDHHRLVPQGSGPGVAGAVVTYITPVGTDNCPGATTVQTAGLPSGATFPVGSTVNTFRVTDFAGNTASCSFIVTVSPLSERRQNQHALIALHARTTVLSKGQTVCTAAPTIPCTDYTVTWPPLTPAYVYLVVARGDPEYGILGLSCGIQYDDTPGTGTRVDSWTGCTGGSGGIWLSDTWPASGSGIRVIWDFAGGSACQRTVRGSDGVHAIVGAFSVYSYGNPREFKVTYNTAVTIPELRVVDCRGVESFDFPLSQAARVMFTNTPASFPGYNPCGGSVVGVPEEQVVLTSTRIHAAPNPFASRTGFELALAGAENVEAGVYDVGGRRVSLLYSGRLPAGTHRLEWDGLDMTGRHCQSGIYFIRVERGGGRMGTKVFLLR